MGWGNSYGDWAPYVPVAQRKAQAIKHAAALAKKEKRQPAPVKLEGPKFATTFWGQAWCDNLAAYSDFSNRLPRGGTYVRNGSVVDLVIEKRTIRAIVAGSDIYKVKITIEGLAKATWKKIKQDCSASIESLLDLLAGRFSDGVMQRLTKKGEGLFPSAGHIKMECSCPDYSYCCKHLAAVMYGVSNRLDKQPELLFLLRDVDHQELVSAAVAEGNLERELSSAGTNALAGADLGALFGIEIETAPAVAPPAKRKPAKTKPSAKPTSAKPAASATTVAAKPKPKPKAGAVANSTGKKAAAKPIAKAMVKIPAAEKSVLAEKTKKPRSTTAETAKRAPSKKAGSKATAGIARRTK